MDIHGFQKLTLTDYPGKLAAIIFTGGCNFRCPYCHNGNLVVNPNEYPKIPDREIFSYLEQRRGVLEGVVVTGGEPTIQPDLAEYIARIKDYDYLVKLDTNGTRPDVVRYLAERHLIDYVAMDIKNSPLRYAETVGCRKVDMGKIEETIRYLLEGHVDYEFRTTMTAELHGFAELPGIADLIHGTERYHIQNFMPNPNTIEKISHSVPISRLHEYEAFFRSAGIPADIRNE